MRSAEYVLSLFLYLRPGAPCCHMVARPQTSARSHAYVQEDAYAHTHAHPFTHSLTHSLTDTHTHTYAYVHRCRWNAPIINNAKVETGTAAMFSWWHQSGEYWGQTAGGRKWWDHVILLDTTLFVGPCKGFGVTGGPSGQMLVAPPLRTRCLEAEKSGHRFMKKLLSISLGFSVWHSNGGTKLSAGCSTPALSWEAEELCIKERGE